MTLDAINRAAIAIATALLAAGLGTWLFGPRVAAERVLEAGLLALMLTPVLRLATTLAGDLRRRDRVAVVTTLAVASVLGLSLYLALRR
jgi:hypothetical protein